VLLQEVPLLSSEDEDGLDASQPSPQRAGARAGGRGPPGRSRLRNGGSASSIAPEDDPAGEGEDEGDSEGTASPDTGRGSVGHGLEEGPEASMDSAAEGVGRIARRVRIAANVRFASSKFKGLRVAVPGEEPPGRQLAGSGSG
jgi:hypothetical protein